MADISSYVTATIARQLSGLQDAVIERNELLKMLKKKGRFKFNCGGDTINWRVYVTEPSIGGSTTDWGIRNAQTVQPFQTASVRYAQYDWPIVMSMFQLQRNENGEQNVKLFDQMAEELNTVRQSAISRIGRHAYTGTGTNYTGDQGTNMSGLTDIINSTAGQTYAGLSATTYSVWDNQRRTISPSGVSAAEIDTDGNNVPQLIEAMRLLSIDCTRGANPNTAHINDQLATDKEEPDFIVTTSAIYVNFDNCLFANMRYNTGASRDPQGDLLFNGVQVKWDTFCPSGKLYMLNSNHLRIDSCGKTIIEAPPALQARPTIERNAQIWKLLGQMQFIALNRRYHGVLTVS